MHPQKIFRKLGMRLAMANNASLSGDPVDPPVTPLFSNTYASGYLAAGDTYARASDDTFTDFEDVVRTVPEPAIPVEGARLGYNLATSLTTHSITVESGREYTVAIAGDSAAQVVCSNAFTGTIVADGTNRMTFSGGSYVKTATTSTLTLTITGTLTQVQVEDVTGATDQVPSTWIDFSADHGANKDGLKYFTTENGNSVDANGVVNEGTGAAITGTYLALRPAATNIIRYSKDYTHSSWLKNKSVITADAITSPIAGVPGQILGDDSSTGTGIVSVQKSSLTVTSGDNTATVFAKKHGVSWLEIVAGSFDAAAYAYFDLDNGVVGGSVVGGSAVIEDAGNGWYKCSFTFNTTTDLVGWIQHRVAEGNGNDNCNLDGTSSIYIIGSQLNAGSEAGSYIPTTSGIENRAAFSLSRTVATPNETRAVVDGADVDVDDWDGVTDATLLGADGSGALTSITVYSPGDRPA